MEMLFIIFIRVIVQQRWVRNGSAAHYMYRTLDVPYLVMLWLRRNLKKAAYYQGTGRHTDEEIDHIQERDLHALSQYLGNYT